MYFFLKKKRTKKKGENEWGEDDPSRPLAIKQNQAEVSPEEIGDQEKECHVSVSSVSGDVVEVPEHLKNQGFGNVIEHKRNEGRGRKATWGEATMKKKEEPMPARLVRRRGLEEEEFTESSMPARRPTRNACVYCNCDILINDNYHRIMCDSRGRHSFCESCVVSHIESWINGGEQHELRPIRFGTESGVYALPCMSNECEYGCLQEIQLRSLLHEPTYNNFRQKLNKTRAERTASISQSDAVSQEQHARSAIQQQQQMAHQLTENPRQLSSRQREQLAQDRLTLQQERVQLQQDQQLRGQEFLHRQHLLYRQQQFYLQEQALQQQQRELTSSGPLRGSLPSYSNTRSHIAPAAAVTDSNEMRRHSTHSQYQFISGFAMPTPDHPTYSEFLQYGASSEPLSQQAAISLNSTIVSSWQEDPINRLLHTSLYSQQSDASFAASHAVQLELQEDIQPLPSQHRLSSRDQDSMLTCQCCYEEFPSQAASMICCQRQVTYSRPHYFCNSCVRSYVEEWLFGEATYALRSCTDTKGEPVLVLRCLYGDCLNGGLADKEVQKVLSVRVMDKYREKMSYLRIKEDDEERLSKIAIRMSLEEEEMRKKVTQLQQEQLKVCSGESFANLPRHMVSVGIPLPPDFNMASPATSISSSITSARSSQSNQEGRTLNSTPATNPEQEKYEKSLHEVEEEMTQAKLRTCPVCSMKFLKDGDFCNKLKCPSCHTAICYICRDILPSRGYDHFCIHKRGGCSACLGKHCPLWTSAEQDHRHDEAEIRERGSDAANRIWEKSLLEDTSSGQPEIRVDVDKLFQQPPRTSHS